MPASTVNLREIQAPIKARYLERPEEAVIECIARSAGSDLADPLHCEITLDSAPGLVLRSGAHTGVGGAGDVPCSGDLLVAALLACQETTIRMVAAAMGIELEEIKVTATAIADLRGTLAMSREVPVGMTGIDCQVRVRVRDDGRGERAQRLLENAEKYCIVLNTLRNGVDVKTEFKVESV
ncbi:MAG: OsmC family protein [Candidatus Dormibacteraeota bacterium]|nr:OsmC family protein [Candidatus Dormibacteraeota bacterium]